MKNVKMLLSAVAVFAIVGGALAFSPRSFQAGSVFCSSTVPDPNQSCPGNAIHQKVVTSGGSLTNPCAPDAAYDGSVSGACTPTVIGTTQFLSTGF